MIVREEWPGVREVVVDAVEALVWEKTLSVLDNTAWLYAQERPAWASSSEANVTRWAVIDNFLQIPHRP